MNIKIGEKALITTSNWFYAPNGVSYKAVFGTVKGIKTSEETLGVKTNRGSTNWYVEIGDMVVAGCQINYAIKTDHCWGGKAEGWTSSAADGIKIYDTPCAIYFADNEEE